MFLNSPIKFVSERWHMDDITNCKNHLVEKNNSQLPKSEIFGILQNNRRRLVLEILKQEGKLTVRSLSEEIACLEAGMENPKSSVRKSVYVSLLQTHIPKMERLKIINYNRERDSVELLPLAHDFEIYMETVTKGDIPWNQFYLGLSLLAIVGTLMICSGLMKWITSSQWMLFTDLAFFFSSILHSHHIHKTR